MGSTQPSDVNLPFGYNLDPSDPDNFLLENPPEPAPGQPLLSQDETRILTNFFEDMTGDHYASASFGEGLNFSDDWLNLQFMGHTTSFGQQSAVQLESQLNALPDGLPGMFHQLMPPPSTASSMMPPPPPPPTQPQQQPPQRAHHTPSVEQQQQHPSADVLAAATLLQNGSMGRSNRSGHDGIFTTSDAHSPMGPPSVGHLRHQPLAGFRQAERRMSQPHMVNEHDNTFTDMMFGSAQRPMTAPRAAQATVDVQWGSDSNFARRSFVPPSEKETSEALLNERLAYMDCLEVSSSAATTRAPSPSHLQNGHNSHRGRNGKAGIRDSSPLKLKTRDPRLAVKHEVVEDGRVRKRRKSKARDEEIDEEEEEGLQLGAITKGPAKKRKSKTESSLGASPESSEAPGKRRKSAANSNAKQPRENLSESQKRENHIKSEQKRRTVIKEGFDDLCDLVPGLKGGGFSKSTMLAMAGEWLEEIIIGNQQLAAQLAKLQDGH